MNRILSVRSKIYDQFHLARGYSAAGLQGDQFAAYYNSMYLIQDTGEAVSEHVASGFSSSPLTAYLEFWGVTQAITIQQDAVVELHQAIIGKRPRVETKSAWQKLREVRNI